MSRYAAQPAKVTWTYDDCQRMPSDGQRYEVIDGELYATPSPTRTHQTVSKRIQLALVLQIEERGLGVVFNAPLDVIFSSIRTVQPDLVVIRTERRNIITERGIEGAPDLVVEILSPSTEDTDRNVKQRIYASEGVGEYWIVDPVAHAIEVYELTETGYRQRGRHAPGDRVASGVFDINLEIDTVFR